MLKQQPSRPPLVKVTPAQGARRKRRERCRQRAVPPGDGRHGGRGAHGCVASGLHCGVVLLCRNTYLPLLLCW